MNQDINALFWRGNATDGERQRFLFLRECNVHLLLNAHRTCFANQIRKPSSTAFYLDSNVSLHLLLAWPYCTCCVCQKKSITNENKYGKPSLWTCQDLNYCTCQNLFSLLLWLMTWPRSTWNTKTCYIPLTGTNCYNLQKPPCILGEKVSVHELCFKMETFLSHEKVY